jgi:type IV conjugative transfer system lipoprotein TraV
MNRVLIVAAVLLTLSACASNKPYACKLNEQGRCNTMQEVYDAARKAPRNTARQHVMETQYFAQQAQGVPHNPNAHMEPGETGQPIFKQPRVYRVWLAPYVDADGNLRSGEYTYFSTPGEWAYGTTREAGAASGATFGPQHPDNVGFTPVESSSNKRTPPKPGDAHDTQTARDGVTQPAQRLTR